MNTPETPDASVQDRSETIGGQDHPTPPPTARLQRALATPPAFPRGARVRCQRDKPTNEGWAQYDGRIGVVTVPNNLGEVGVVFDNPKNNSAAVWFLPSELVRLRGQT